VDFAVTDHTIGGGHESAVGGSMTRRHSVALHTGAVSGLFEQSFIGGTVRLMTFRASFSFYEVIVNHGVFVKEGTGLFGMAVLAGPVDTDGPERILDTIAVVAIDALDIMSNQRVSRTQVEFRDHGRMTASAEIFSFRIHQIHMGIVVNLVAGRALHPGDGMRIVGTHGRLMRGLMTTGTNHCLVDRGRIRSG
jgi:hypothetical protein